MLPANLDAAKGYKAEKILKMLIRTTNRTPADIKFLLCGITR